MVQYPKRKKLLIRLQKRAEKAHNRSNETPKKIKEVSIAAQSLISATYLLSPLKFEILLINTPRLSYNYF